MEINILLFPGFETLDAFGPAEVLGRAEEYVLRFVSLDGGAVHSAQGVPVVTERLDTASGGILLVPGGIGTRALVRDEAFLRALREAAACAAWCLTVCTGSALLAATGLLDGVRATSNKRAFSWVRTTGERVCWQPRARWVADGKYYSSSGISAGIDMSLGFMADRFGTQRAEAAAHDIEYLWNRDPENDPFAAEDC